MRQTCQNFETVDWVCSDQVFRIGSKKTVRHVEAIIERNPPSGGGYLHYHNHHYHYD